MARTEVKLHEWMIEGLGLYKKNFSLLVLSSLLVLLLSIPTGGILAGPMMAGLVGIVLGLYGGEEVPAGAGDVFKGFRRFGPMFFFCLIWGLLIGIPTAALSFIPVVGKALALVFALIGYSFLMFVPFLIVDRGLGFWSASVKSIKTVGTNWRSFSEFGGLAAVFGQAGALLCGLGLFLTLPIQACMLAVAYREIFCGVVTKPAVRPKDEASHIIAAAAAQRTLSGKESGDQAVRATLVRQRIQTPEQESAWEITEKEVEEIEKNDGLDIDVKAPKDEN